MKFPFFCALGALTLALGAQAAPPAASVPGVTTNSILIGQSIVLTGPASEVGASYFKGQQLAIAEANAKGGVHGRKIELESIDDGYDPKRAEENTRKLIEEKQVFALFGHTGTGAVMAAQAIAEKAGVPMVAPLTGSDPMREKPAGNLFFLRASYADEMEKIVEHQATLGIGRIALLYQDDAFGKASRRSFEEAMARHKLTPVAMAPVDPQSMDVSAAVAEITRTKPMAVILGSTGKISVAMVKGMYQANLRPQVFGLSVLSPALLRAELQNNISGIVMTQIVPSPWNAKHSIVRQYRAALGDKIGEAHHASLEGYVAGRVLVEALRRAGKELTRQGLLDALAAMRKYDLGDYVVDFANPRHTGSRYVELAILRADGSFAN